MTTEIEMTDTVAGAGDTAETITARRRMRMDHDHPRYKWVVLSNTTLGTLLATINASIVLISLPAIFRGIGLNPLAPGNVSYLLWMLMGYLVVTAVLVVPFGRLGDMLGRVRIYNWGFVVFTLAAVALSFDPFHLGGGALWLIGWRVIQGVGGAMLMASSSAILTDAFPANQRGMALGVNMVAAVAGSFLGLLIGGFLSEWHWKAIFWVGVPIGILGTIWSVRSLRELGARTAGRLDWPGTLTFGVGLTVLLAGITYGIQPYGDSTTGWTNPLVLGAIAFGLLSLVAFCFIELHVDSPMVDVRLFRSASFGMGNLAGLMSSMGRGGLQFMLIIWLQGIWLPLHGYSFESTPLWAGIYLLPITVRLPGGRTDCRLAVRPLRRAAVHCRRHAADGGDLHCAGDDPGELQLLGVRRSGVPQRPRRRHLHRAQHRGDHVERARRPARRRVRCAGDLLQRGLVAVDRCLLLADDRRAGQHAADRAQQRPAGAGRLGIGRPRRRRTCHRWAACSPRSSATTPSRNCWPRRARCISRVSMPMC